jgi:Ala-tRNA(Pro) deacylase
MQRMAIQLQPIEAKARRVIMTSLQRCIDTLERFGIHYVHTKHANAYRAKEVAEVEHLPPSRLAKAVILRDQTDYIMAVLAADCNVDLTELAAKLNVPNLRLATEEEVRRRFPDSEIGAVPPIGPLFGMRVYMDVRLVDEDYIFFNAGTHRDAIHMKAADYIRLTDPVILQFAYLNSPDLTTCDVTWR